MPALSAAIVVGTNPATTGTIRIPSTGSLWARNAANTANFQVITTNAADEIVLSGSGQPMRTNSALFVPNTQPFGFRNAANSADIWAIGASAADVIILSPQQYNIAVYGHVSFLDGKNITTGATTGTKIGTAATEKLGFFGATPVVRPTGTAAVATDLATALTLVNDLRSKLITLGHIS